MKHASWMTLENVSAGNKAQNLYIKLFHFIKCPEQANLQTKKKKRRKEIRKKKGLMIARDWREQDSSD
jgi:hypothetical protein